MARLLTPSQQQYVPTPDEAKRAEREARLAKLHTKPREQKKTPSNAPTVRSHGPRRRRAASLTLRCAVRTKLGHKRSSFAGRAKDSRADCVTCRAFFGEALGRSPVLVASHLPRDSRRTSGRTT
jgi:hypothetical protein